MGSSVADVDGAGRRRLQSRLADVLPAIDAIVDDPGTHPRLRRVALEQVAAIGLLCNELERLRRACSAGKKVGGLSRGWASSGRR